LFGVVEANTGREERRRGELDAIGLAHGLLPSLVPPSQRKRLSRTGMMPREESRRGSAKTYSPKCLEEEFCEVAFRPGDSSRIHRHPLGCGRMGMEGQVTIETEVGGVLCQSTMKIR
jgi:hypothetical protein